MIDIAFVGIAIIFAGFLVVFIAIVTSSGESQDAEKGAQVKGGAVIMIGPIPIVFGSDAKWASIAMVLAIVLIVIVLLSGVLMSR